MIRKNLLTLVNLTCIFLYEHWKYGLGCPKNNIVKLFSQNICHEIILMVEVFLQVQL